MSSICVRLRLSSGMIPFYQRMPVQGLWSGLQKRMKVELMVSSGWGQGCRRLLLWPFGELVNPSIHGTVSIPPHIRDMPTVGLLKGETWMLVLLAFLALELVHFGGQ